MRLFVTRNERRVSTRFGRARQLHERFDLHDLPRRARDPFHPVRRGDVIVLDADSDVAIMLDGRAQLGGEGVIARRLWDDVENVGADVDPRLDRERASHGDDWLIRVVHLEADAVTEAVHVKEVVLRTLRRLTADVAVVARVRRLDETKSR